MNNESNIMSENKESYAMLDAITQYISEVQTTGSLLLTGKWGSGKTWFINNSLKEELVKLEHNVISVSLFGIDCSEQLKKAVNYASFEAKMVGKNSKVKSFLSKTKPIAKNIPILKEYVDLDSLLELVPLPDNAVLIFDDLERCTLSMEVLLGLINHYIECSGVKVIIIANEDVIEDDKYREFKEKVISQTIEYQPDFNGIIKAIINKISNKDYSGFLHSKRTLLQKWLLQECASNFRLLIRAVQHYERIFSSINTVLNKDDYEDIEQYYEDYFSLYLSVFAKVTHPHELCKEISSKKDVIEQVLTALKKDHFYNEPIVRWILTNEWNECDITKNILYTSDKYKTASPANKILRISNIESILSFDDETFIKGWCQLIEMFDKDGLEHGYFQRLLLVQDRCNDWGVSLPFSFDNERITKLAKKHESKNSHMILGTFIQHNGGTQLICEMYNSQHVRYVNKDKNTKLQAFLDSPEDGLLRELFPYIDSECGEAIAKRFNFSTNEDRCRIISSFNYIYTSGLYMEVHDYKQRNAEMLSKLEENLSQITTDNISISIKLQHDFSEIINKYLQKFNEEG